MTVYFVTPGNWNHSDFWGAIDEAGPGHTLDFSALTSDFSIVFDPASNSLVISQGNQTFSVEDADGSGGSSAALGGSSLFAFFTTVTGGAGDDDLRGTDADNYYDGGGGDDTLTGGDGDDTLLGGDGEDVISGEAGSDALWGGTGADHIDGGAGADTFFIEDGFGSDTIIGGEQISEVDWDTVDLSALTTSISVAYYDNELGSFSDPDNTNTAYFSEIESFILTAQSDFFTSGADAFGHFVEAGDGDDTIYSGLGNDTLSGGDGADEIYGDAGDDVITGGAGGDDLGGNAGNDTISGEVGDDYIQGMAGNDSLSGGDGVDTMSGGDGDDTLASGRGDDQLRGGDGDDVFVYSVGDGADRIKDFNTGNSGALGDGDITNNDFIDLSQFYDHIYELRADYADDSLLNQSNATDIDGNAVDYSNNSRFGSGDSLAFDGADQSSFTSDNTGVVCFTTGTLILTPSGEVPIEKLRVGDLVVTMDNGPQPLIWSSVQTLGPEMLLRAPGLKPIEIKPGVLGNHSPLVVSPQHGLWVSLGNDEALVRAKHLGQAYGGSVRVKAGCRRVAYHHLLFERHEVIFANGAASESFFPGPQAMAALKRKEYACVTRMFPMLHGVSDTKIVEQVYGSTARRFLSRSVVHSEFSPPKIADVRPLMTG